MRHAILISLGIASVASPLAAQTEIPPDLADLADPRITVKPSQPMLVVEATGDPTTVGAEAFGLLFQLYYTSPVTPKGPQQAAPRARWPVEFDQPRAEWVGIYALPVPAEMTELPDHTPPPGFEAKLETWEYGEVAEILHVGPYDREEPTIERLRAFIAAQDYAVTGPHEEEYIRGPTMSGPGDPEQYLTILRFDVAPVSDAVPAQEPAPGEPGPEHAELMSLVGSWEVSISDQPVGSARATSRLDGRFLQVELEAETGPVTHAIYTFGFDRRHGRHIVSAMDNSGTYWVTAQGMREGDRIPMYGKDDDPVMASMGFEKEFVIVLYLHGPDHVEIQTLFVDTRTPERNEIPFMSFDLRRVAEDLSGDVRQAELAFAATMAERDLDAFATFVAHEAVFVGGGRTLRGVDAIRDGWSTYFDGPKALFSWEPEQVVVLDSGTLALSSGPVRDPTGKLIGTFNSIWRREAGGDWKVVFDKGCPVCAQESE